MTFIVTTVTNHFKCNRGLKANVVKNHMFINDKLWKIVFRENGKTPLLMAKNGFLKTFVSIFESSKENFCRTNFFS